MFLKMFGQDKEANNDDSESTADYYDAEILDEMTTHRGELKLRTVSFNDRNSDRNPSFHEDRF